jgi:hypothetical protein
MPKAKDPCLIRVVLIEHVVSILAVRGRDKKCGVFGKGS